MFVVDKPTTTLAYALKSKLSPAIALYTPSIQAVKTWDPKGR